MSVSTHDSIRAKYGDPEYQNVHLDLFLNSIIKPIPRTLPPGVPQSDFDLAVTEFSEALGKANVYGQDEVQEYIDPYELNEDEGNRKIPSGAVWFVHLQESTFCSLLTVATVLIRFKKCNTSSRSRTSTKSHCGHSLVAKTWGQFFCQVIGVAPNSQLKIWRSGTTTPRLCRIGLAPNEQGDRGQRGILLCGGRTWCNVHRFV